MWQNLEREILEEFATVAKTVQPRFYGLNEYIESNRYRQAKWRANPVNREKKRLYMIEYRKRAKK